MSLIKVLGSCCLIIRILYSKFSELYSRRTFMLLMVDMNGYIIRLWRYLLMKRNISLRSRDANLSQAHFHLINKTYFHIYGQAII